MGSVLEVGLESLFRGETLQTDVADGTHDALDIPVLEDVPADGHPVSSGVETVSNHVQDVHVGIHLRTACDDNRHLCTLADTSERVHIAGVGTLDDVSSQFGTDAGRVRYG